MRGVIRVHVLAAREHDVDGADVQPGGPACARVPSVAAAEREPAQTHRAAVADRKEDSCLGQRRVEVTAERARADSGDHRVGVDGDPGERGEVEEHATRTQAVAVPAVAAGAHRDAQALGRRVAHAPDHVLVGRRQQDPVGMAVGLAGVPDRVAASRLVLGVVAAKQSPVRRLPFGHRGVVSHGGRLVPHAGQCEDERG